MVKPDNPLLCHQTGNIGLNLAGPIPYAGIPPKQTKSNRQERRKFEQRDMLNISFDPFGIINDGTLVKCVRSKQPVSLIF